MVSLETQNVGFVEEQPPYRTEYQWSSSRGSRLLRALAQIPLALALVNTGIVQADIWCANTRYAAVATLHEDTADKPFRVSTFNIARGIFGLSGVSEALRGQEVDVQCLQEAPERGLDELMAASRLGNIAVNWNGEIPFSRYGNVTLTNLPIISSAEYSLPSLSNHHPRSALFTVLEDTSGERFVVANAHVAAQNGFLKGEAVTEREAQIETLINVLNGPEYTDLPFVLCVDLNESPGGSSYQQLDQRLNDTAQDIRQPTEGLITLPGYRTQADYLWRNNKWRTSEIAIFGSGEGTDHCGLSGTFYRRPLTSQTASLLRQGPV